MRDKIVTLIALMVIAAFLVYLMMIVELEHQTYAEIKSRGQHAEQVKVESWTIKFNWLGVKE